MRAPAEIEQDLAALRYRRRNLTDMRNEAAAELHLVEQEIAILARDKVSAETALATGCEHPAEKIAAGPRIPLLHGSAESEACTGCGAYRTLHYGPGPWQVGPPELSPRQDD